MPNISEARVEDFQPDDTEALVRMWRASFEFGVGITDPNPLHEQVEYLRSKIVPFHRVRVAKLAGTIVGFLAANAESVAQLHVRVDNIGQGIGSRLIRLAQAESSGSLWLFTFVKNTRACRFYEHHGFVAVAHGFEPVWKLDDVKYQWINGARAARPGGPQGIAMAASVTLDVFGRRMLVEREEGMWRTYELGSDGKRSPVNIAIPDTMPEAELAQYFDDIYHEAATPQRRAVIRLA